MKACGHGDSGGRIEILEHVLLHGGDPNGRSPEGLTPVHIASSWGFVSVLRTLVRYGGDPWLEDDDGYNAWDLALQKSQWDVLKFLASHMERDAEDDAGGCSFERRFNTRRQVSDAAFLYNSALSEDDDGALNNAALLEATVDSLGSSATSSSGSASTTLLNEALCSSSSSSASSSVVVVEEFVYSDREKGVDLIEWHYPPLVTLDATADATLNEALDTGHHQEPKQQKQQQPLQVDDEAESMDSQLLVDQLAALGWSRPGPITATTKRTYQRQLQRLRRQQQLPAAAPSSPKPRGHSKELQRLMASYPPDGDWAAAAARLDRLFVTHFACADPAKPWREGLAKKSFNYVLLDPRRTRNLPATDEPLTPAAMLAMFVAAVFYVGKGKQTRPYEHLYEAVKIRARPATPHLKIGRKMAKILDIWADGHGVVSLHVFQNSLPVEAYCREAALIDAVGLANAGGGGLANAGGGGLANAKRGDYYGVCTGWSDADKRLWGAHLIHKAFQIFLHEGERQIRPVDL